MRRKFSLLLLAFCCGLFLTGCNDVIDLTDEETDMIAEYAAGLLLRYDANYVDHFAEVEDSNTTQQEEITGTEESQEITTEQPEEATSEEASSGNNINSNISEENANPDNGTSGTETNIARIAGLEEVDITYKDYIITDHYPATDADGEFIYLDASDGYQLLVVRFGVVSKADKEVSISLFDKNIDYRIVCNKSHAADPMLTILMDDLGTFEATLAPGQEQTAVLVFQIADSMKDNLSSIHLNVKYNNTDNTIKILD